MFIYVYIFQIKKFDFILFKVTCEYLEHMYECIFQGQLMMAELRCKIYLILRMLQYFFYNIILTQYIYSK